MNGNPFQYSFPFSMHDNRLEDIVYQQSDLRGGNACQTEESSSQEGPSTAAVAISVHFTVDVNLTGRFAI